MENRFGFISPETENLYFSGILGASLSSLALISRLKGYTVSGSDTGSDEEIMKKLKENKIKVNKTQIGKNVEGFDAFIYSAAISEDNPEFTYAKNIGIPMFTRSEFLGGIISEYKNKIGICGTHGKSTVSGMITEIFLFDRRDVTSLIGAKSVNLDSAFRLGNGDTVIYEACEYKRSFLDFLPTISVVLNIEKEHIDCYPTLSDSILAYMSFVKKSECCILNLDN